MHTTIGHQEAVLAQYERLVCRFSHTALSAMPRTCSYTFEDLCQEGRARLLIALNAFDPDRGLRFMTLLYTALQRHYARLVAKEYRYSRQIPTLFEDIHVSVDPEQEARVVVMERVS